MVPSARGGAGLTRVLVLAAAVLALVSPLLRGRSLVPLALVRLRGIALVWLSLLLQTVLTVTTLRHAVAVGLHLASYVLAAAFVVVNIRVPGVAIIALGAACNGVTIALNGGTLPARPEAMRAAGIEAGEDFANSGVVEDPVLPWLGDVFPWPEPLPLANVFSVGDVVIVLGVGYGAHRICAARRPAEHAVGAPPAGA